MSPVSKSPYPHRLLYSIHGLLIFTQEFPSKEKFKHFIIVNPLTKEKVRLVTPPGEIIGAFLNPSSKDQYCLLWTGLELRPDGSARNIIIVLGGRSGGTNSQTQTCCCWRELYDDAAALFSYLPHHVVTTMVNDVLYWMVRFRYATSRLGTSPPGTQLAHTCAESIMAFNTRTEKFSVMPHPGPHQSYWCQEDPKHGRVYLVDVNEDHGRSRFLCLCEHSLLEPVINLWILEQRQVQDGDDKSRPSWIRWHRLDFHMLFGKLNSYDPFDRWLEVSAIVSGEAYITFSGVKGLFAIDLKGVRAQRIRARLSARLLLLVHVLFPWEIVNVKYGSQNSHALLFCIW